MIESILDHTKKDLTGEVWLHVRLLDPLKGKGAFEDQLPGHLIYSVCERDDASVRLSSVMSAIELWDT